MNLSLEKIRLDGGTQSRVKIDDNLVAEYAEMMQAGVEFPPVVVFYDGTDYWLSDGFHRYLARKRIKAPGIQTDQRDGTVRDAVLFGISANNKHGKRPTNEDKRKGVITILMDIEWQDMSDRQIAQICGVSHTYVGQVRKDLKSGNVATKQKPRQPKQQKPADPVAEFERELQRETMQAAVNQLREENENLQDKLAVAMAASTDDIQKEKAESVIKDLRAQLRAAEIELKEVTASRDMYQRENGELKKQVQSLLKKLKKLEG
jgi:DNA-binding transcriptional regulator GbsR (MarR family)